jgi:RHS repeat-associated protein
VIDAAGTYTFTYDNMNRLSEADTDYKFDTAGTLAVKYGYDAASNRTSMTDPQNLGTAYTYDVLNRLFTLAFNGQTPVFQFGYDALSRRTSLTRPNLVNTTYAYDPASSLTSVLHKLGTTTLDGATYTYDNAENRKTRTDKRLNTTLNYTYDNIYQLLLAKQGTTVKESYTYVPDLVGNRLISQTGSPLVTTTYQPNTSNELVSTTNPNVSYTYDNNGNLKTKSDGTQYNWDFENRLTSVVLPGAGGTVSFKYDGFGRRVQKVFVQGANTTTTDYLYDGPNLLEEVDVSGNMLARYEDTTAIDELLSEVRSGNTSYYEADGMGSITSLSTSAGSLVNTYTYDSFGKLTASTGTVTNPFQYTGREFDPEIGIYEYRARYYDQSIGRFISEDPLRLGAGINFYSYVFNSPTNYEDPDGLRTRVCCRQLESGFRRFGKKHCFIAISGNPDVFGGQTVVYSMDRFGSYGFSYGQPLFNNPADVNSFNNNTATCYEVPNCTRCKENKIRDNAGKGGPAGGFGYFGYPGPNSNTYVAYQLYSAGCQIPNVPNAPGLSISPF